MKKLKGVLMAGVTELDFIPYLFNIQTAAADIQQTDDILSFISFDVGRHS